MLLDRGGQRNLKRHAGKPAVLTKSDLIEEVSCVLQVPQKDAAAVVESLFGAVVRAIHRGDKVEIRGFGSFRTRQRGPRIGRNPKTGAPVNVPAKRIPFFKPSQELRALVDEGKASIATR